MKLLDIFNLLLNHFGKQYWWPAKTKDEIIIGAILTQNTSWKNVEKSIKNLRNANLTELKKLVNASDLNLLIKPSGFFNQKAEYLKNIASALDKNKVAEMPTNKARKYLLSIKGIGKETADSILLYAFEKPIFVVDAYTKRIFSRLGLIDKNLKYDEIQKFFMKNLPEDIYIYNEFHALIVMLGKNFCGKQKPNCKNCPLNKICKKIL